MDDFAQDARRWARQTIIFTIQYEPTGAKTAADEQAQLVKASARSAEIVGRLWATAEVGSSGLAEAVRKFIWLVLEWSSKNLSECDVALVSSNRGPEHGMGE